MRNLAHRYASGPDCLLQRFDGDIYPDGVAELEAVSDGLGKAKDAHGGPSENMLFHALAHGGARHVVHVQRRIAHSGSFDVCRESNIDRAGDLGGYAVKVKSGYQTDDPGRHALGYGYDIRLAGER